MSNTLNCHSRNGDIINENTAVSVFFGKKMSIAQAYNQSRRDENNNIASADNFHHLEIKGVVMDKSDAALFYESLWFQFFYENPEILKKIRAFDNYVDEHSEPNNTMNSTARVFNILKISGLNGLKSNIKDFSQRFRAKLHDLNSSLQPQETSFEFLDSMAKRIVRQNADKDLDTVLDSCVDLSIHPLIREIVTFRYEEFHDMLSQGFLKMKYEILVDRFNKLQQK